MAGFDILDPVLQHHVVNSLGWPGLRPLQDEAAEPIVGGSDAILLAPTAGGKTEAAMFPLLTRMQTEHWTGISVLYICPLKALLNNLQPRLAEYAAWLGRGAMTWHGDVAQSVRGRIKRDRPDILLTTPESLESMLVSENVDAAQLLGGVQAVVVDEVHAFAGDDRGWHLLAVLARLESLLGRKLQRVGMSATVGNPDELLGGWLQGRAERPGLVVSPPSLAAVRSFPTSPSIPSAAQRTRRRSSHHCISGRSDWYSSILDDWPRNSGLSCDSEGLQHSSPTLLCPQPSAASLRKLSPEHETASSSLRQRSSSASMSATSTA